MPRRLLLSNKSLGAGEVGTNELAHDEETFKDRPDFRLFLGLGELAAAALTRVPAYRFGLLGPAFA